jgi:hypothetical protein
MPSALLPVECRAVDSFERSLLPCIGMKPITSNSSEPESASSRPVDALVPGMPPWLLSMLAIDGFAPRVPGAESAWPDTLDLRGVSCTDARFSLLGFSAALQRRSRGVEADVLLAPSVMEDDWRGLPGALEEDAGDALARSDDAA